MGQKSPKRSGKMSTSGGNCDKGICTSLLPFMGTIVIYMACYVPMENQTFNGMILKCSPIAALAYFVYSRGLSMSDPKHSYERKIFFGLIFAGIGDAFLDFPGYFGHGTVSFAIAQILNICAFGMKPLNLSLGLKTFAVMGLPLLFVTPGLLKAEFPLNLLISGYTPLLITMIWRSIATFAHAKRDWTWKDLFPCVGGISFGISDAFVALNLFYTPIPYAQLIIMSTYYFAQFGIAMSILKKKSKGD